MFRQFVFFLSCATLGQRHALPKPSAMVQLPMELYEVSGITDMEDGTLACLQDEEATLYLIDPADGHVRERHTFGPPGDMEGLTRVGQDLFALRSDGLVYQVRRSSVGYAVVDSFVLELAHQNIEGLGYDERMHRVLVAPKDIAKGENEMRDQRRVFAFDPDTRVQLPHPVLEYSLSKVLAEANARGIKVPTRTTPKGRQVPVIKLRMSSIAVDPVSDNYYILSAVDRSLLVLDRNGTFVDLFFLDPAQLPKPEGITFMPGGDMIITTEGKGTPPRLLRYDLR